MRSVDPGAIWDAIDNEGVTSYCGAPTVQLYWQFVRWWLPIATPVSLVAFACMFLNVPRDPR